MGAPQIFENLIQAKRLHSLSALTSRVQVQQKEAIMKKVVAVAGLFLSLALAGSGFAQIDRTDEVEALKNGLSSGSSAHRVKTAKLITQAGIVDQALYEQVAALLKAGYADGTGSDHVDEMSWLCKALAASGDPKYIPLLEEIADKAPSFKLTHYAEQSIDLIEEYASRIRILNSTETWDDDLSDEENRLVNMLNSDKIQLKRDAAKTVVRRISVHEKVYEAVAAELQKMLAEGRTSSQDIDTMAWMCKALAASGDRKYAETLKQVHDGTTSVKLKTYASKALKQID
jgi:hypothetical protein